MALASMIISNCLILLMIASYASTQEKFTFNSDGKITAVTPATRTVSITPKKIQHTNPTRHPIITYRNSQYGVSRKVNGKTTTSPSVIFKPAIETSTKKLEGKAYTTPRTLPFKINQQFYTTRPNVKIISSTTAKPLTTKIPIQKLSCPTVVKIPFFSLPCKQHKDCNVFGPGLACCKERCIKGVLVPDFNDEKKIRKPRVLNVTSSANEIVKQEPKPQKVCPGKEVRLPIFSLPCKSDKDCAVFGRQLLCCRDRCLEGVLPPKDEVHHQPLFGVIERQCPVEPLVELFDVKECESDVDCRPRICCPERNAQGVRSKSYCRTAVHNIEKIPGVKRFQEPIKNFVSYMQCTPPPAKELFPKPCQNTLDCFPNLCCLENGKKHCRPPKRSLVALAAGVTANAGFSEITKRFIQRITT